MLIRKYRPGEEPELWKLFFHTIRTVNVRDYTPEQVSAWAPDDVGEAYWRSRIEGIDPWVCVHDGVIVGYADLQDSGYIDHFFVHHEFQGRGVGKRLFETIEAEARRQGLPELFAHVSITARPFFESRGFRVVRERKSEPRGVALTNFHMIKRLGNS